MEDPDDLQETRRREHLRASFPTVAQMVDEVRQQFPKARVIWCAENGMTAGPVPDDIRMEQSSLFESLPKLKG